MLCTALHAREQAYAPYSGFKVGAAVMGGSGRVYTGCNVENASYGLTLCAERVAVLKAISEGETHIRAVAIVAGGDLPARPCGACLQVIWEFTLPDEPVTIAVATPDLRCEVRTLSDYLPMPFRLDLGTAE